MCRTGQRSHRVSMGVSILPLFADGSVGLFVHFTRSSWLGRHFSLVLILILVLVLVGLLFLFVLAESNFSFVTKVTSLRLSERRPFLLLIFALELGNTTLEVSDVLNSCLENGELVHLHTLTGRDHVFEHSKLFIHLTSSPTFDDAMCSLACNLPPSRTRGRGLFPLGVRRGPGRLRCRIRRTGRRGGRLVTRITVWRGRRLGFHLDDFPRSTRGWREGVGGRVVRGATPHCRVLCGLDCPRSGPLVSRTRRERFVLRRYRRSALRVGRGGIGVFSRTIAFRAMARGRAPFGRSHGWRWQCKRGLHVGGVYCLLQGFEVCRSSRGGRGSWSGHTCLPRGTR